MKKYQYLFFDLDGTLTDPASGLVEGFVYAFKKMGLPYADKPSLKKYIGPPLFEQWRADFGLTDEQTDLAVLTFREYYNIYGWWDNKVYPGIREMLTELKAAGKRLYVATSKPEDTARRVLAHFDLDGFFEYVGGADTHKTRDKKWEVLSYVMKEAGVGDGERSRCLMIGDRKFDCEGAAVCGIDALGVLWGHGSEEEINAAGFALIARTPAELAEALIK
jgi:phosphoglycolate phosphatase